MFILCPLNVISILKIFAFTSGHRTFFLFCVFIVAIVLPNTVLRLRQTGAHPLKG